MTITDAKGLRRLIDEIHDQWFNVEQIKKDFQDKKLVFKLYRDYKKPTQSTLLQINHVAQLKIKDTEKIGYYDINKVIFNEAEKSLVVSTGVPLGIKIFVDSLEIVLNKPDVVPKREVS